MENPSINDRLHNIEDSLLDDSDDLDEQIHYSPKVESKGNNTRNIVL